MIQFFTKRLKSNKGFTLVELIVVIAILGILGAIAVPRISGITETAQKQADISNAKLIANMVYVADAEGRINIATSNITDGTFDIAGRATHNLSYADGNELSDLLTQNYMKGIPISELTGGNFYLRVRNSELEIFVGLPLDWRNLVYPFPSDLATNAGDNWK
ncbi:type II secretion system protein [Alkaliphilus sp. AH-315-G20]|nr:type II secretion system protein [Alkaliphilus sp. AH-315-G20]